MVSVRILEKNSLCDRGGLLFLPTAVPIQRGVDPEVKGNVTRRFGVLGGNPRGHETVKIIENELIPMIRGEGDISSWRWDLI